MLKRNFIRRQEKKNDIRRTVLSQISSAGIRRIGSRGGATRLTFGVYGKARGVMYTFMENLIQRAILRAHCNHRKTVSISDIKFSISGMGKTLYGFEDVKRHRGNVGAPKKLTHENDVVMQESQSQSQPQSQPQQPKTSNSLKVHKISGSPKVSKVNRVIGKTSKVPKVPTVSKVPKVQKAQKVPTVSRVQKVSMVSRVPKVQKVSTVSRVPKVHTVSRVPKV